MEGQGMECEDWMWYKEVKKWGSDVFRGNAWQFIWFVVGSLIPRRESSLQARGVYCQLSISHQQSGLNLLELPETAQGCTDSLA